MLVLHDALARAERIQVFQEVLRRDAGIRSEEIPVETQACHSLYAANLRKVDAILIFFITAAASVIGSLQAGIVNTAVLAHTVKRGPEAGRRMALGGSIPEFIYAVLAFQFASWLLDALGLSPQGVARLVGGILIALGLYFVLIFKPAFDLEKVNVKASGVRKGLLLGMLNPQLILFWSGVRLALSSFGFTTLGWLEMLCFGLGAFTGALLLLLQLVRLGRRALEKWEPRTLVLLFRAVGGVLVISGLVAIIRS